MFGMIRHYELIFHVFSEKNSASMICTLASFAAQNCHLMIMQPFFPPEISVLGKFKQQINFCLLNVTFTGPGSYRK